VTDRACALSDQEVAFGIGLRFSQIVLGARACSMSVSISVRRRYRL